MAILGLIQIQEGPLIAPFHLMTKNKETFVLANSSRVKCNRKSLRSVSGKKMLDSCISSRVVGEKG